MVFYGKNPLLMAIPIRLAEMLCISDGNCVHQWWQFSMAKTRVLAQFISEQNMSSNFALKFRQEGVILKQVRILWQTKKKTSGIQNRCQNWFWSSQFWEIQAGNRCSYLCWMEEVLNTENICQNFFKWNLNCTFKVELCIYFLFVQS